MGKAATLQQFKKMVLRTLSDTTSRIAQLSEAVSVALENISADQVTFADGKTFQQKLDAGELRGATGATGGRGATGTRGSLIYQGTGVTGTSTTATVFSGSGVSSALVNDVYINTSTWNWYQCTTGGSASTAKWVYKGCLKGATGSTGAKGATGAAGTRGSLIYQGTAITGTSTTATIFSGSGISSALVNDVYINTSTWNWYQCTTAGTSSTAKWAYKGCLKGATGATGATGAAAGFGNVTATVDSNTGTPSVTVTTSGSNTAKNFTFVFKNLKGATGGKGATGATGPAGANGKSAYELAKAAGYTGTEAAFNAALLTLQNAPFLPLAGGTLTGDLRLKNSSNYGMTIRFGDGDLAYIKEPADDVLEIHAKSVRFTGMGTASSNPLPLLQGGTGATTAADARTKLGAQAKTLHGSFTIPTSGWSSDSTTGYPYYYDLSVSGVTASDRADIPIAPGSVSTAVKSGFCPFSETLAGKIRIRAAKVPTSAISAEYWVERG